MKKPNFFILGAPKCGTTSLAIWLSEHPNIYMSPVKEPHFFNEDGLQRTYTLDHYESLFEKADPEKHIAVGEASVWYLLSKVAVPNILKYQPDAKFIVCIRNPIEMVQSLHAQMVFVGYETELDFEKAWRLQRERKKGKNIPLSIKSFPDFLQYGECCKLGSQLNRLFNIVSKEKVLVLLLDDIKKNPKKEYQKVLSFLGVPDDGRKNFLVYNKRKGVKFKYLSYIISFINQSGHILKKKLRIKRNIGFIRFVREINTKPVVKKELSVEIKKELMNFFKEDIILLENLLGKNLKTWLKE